MERGAWKIQSVSELSSEMLSIMKPNEKGLLC